MEEAEIGEETIVDPRDYHTVKEAKNGAGAPPLKTPKGWLHVAHGVRACAAGLRYVLYAFLCDLDDPSRVIARPGGYFMAPEGEERIGDVSNVLFCNGAVQRDDGEVFIYYALLGHPDPRGHDHRGAAPRLRPQHARGPAALRGLRRAAHRSSSTATSSCWPGCKGKAYRGSADRPVTGLADFVIECALESEEEQHDDATIVPGGGGRRAWAATVAARASASPARRTKAPLGLQL